MGHPVSSSAKHKAVGTPLQQQSQWLVLTKPEWGIFPGQVSLEKRTEVSGLPSITFLPLKGSLFIIALLELNIRSSQSWGNLILLRIRNVDMKFKGPREDASPTRLTGLCWAHMLCRAQCRGHETMQFALYFWHEHLLPINTQGNSWALQLHLTHLFIFYSCLMWILLFPSPQIDFRNIGLP